MDHINLDHISHHIYPIYHLCKAILERCITMDLPHLTPPLSTFEYKDFKIHISCAGVQTGGICNRARAVGAVSLPFASHIAGHKQHAVTTHLQPRDAESAPLIKSPWEYGWFGSPAR